MIRLLLADDHPIVREGLKRIVAGCPDMQVVGEVEDTSELPAECGTAGANVLLLDISMPGPKFLDTMRRLRKELAGLKVLVLSMHSEKQYAVRALRAGASGYLTKDHSAEELITAIRQVNRGGRYVTASLAETLAFELGPDAERPPHELLSEREFEVFHMLAEGGAIQDIAHDLSLSPKTISTYRARVLDKMKLENNADLVRYAVKHALID